MGQLIGDSKAERRAARTLAAEHHRLERVKLKHAVPAERLRTKRAIEQLRAETKVKIAQLRAELARWIREQRERVNTKRAYVALHGAPIVRRRAPSKPRRAAARTSSSGKGKGFAARMAAARAAKARKRPKARGPRRR
jgi:hypothetical protein